MDKLPQTVRLVSYEKGVDDLEVYLGKAVTDTEKRYSDVANRVNWLLNRHTCTAGITASTTQSQGQQPLSSEINEVSTCANANDVVTLPSAFAGRRCAIINNGAQTLQIFPASGDDLGGGVDTATTLAAGNTVEFVAYDSTNWRAL